MEFKGCRGQASIEKMVLIVIIITVLVFFQKYILRGINGRWKMVGDGLGAGRLYDPQKTLACKFDYVYTNRWYDEACYEERECYSRGGGRGQCIRGCYEPKCEG